MADITNLTQFLTDVATAIKQKTGKEEKIPAENFDTEILSIETGIDTSSDNPITANDVAEGKEGFVNGEKIIGNAFTVDAGERAIAVIPTEFEFHEEGSLLGYGENLPWSGGQTSTLFKVGSITGFNIPLQTQPDLFKAIGLSADKIVKGQKIFGVEGTAEGGGTEINNQDKEITENGTYTAEEGYTGLGTVNVNVNNKFTDKYSIDGSTLSTKPEINVEYNGNYKINEIGDFILQKYIDNTIEETGIVILRVISTEKSKVIDIIPELNVLSKDDYEIALHLCDEILGPSTSTEEGYAGLISKASTLFGTEIEDDQPEYTSDDDERSLYKTLKIKRGDV